MGDDMKTISRQPMPEKDTPRVLDHVLSDLSKGSDTLINSKVIQEDLISRAEEGKKKYKTYLGVNNSRCALSDAYQEALDLVMYLKQKIMEVEEPSTKLKLAYIYSLTVCDNIVDIFKEGGEIEDR